MTVKSSIFLPKLHLIVGFFFNGWRSWSSKMIILICETIWTLTFTSFHFLIVFDISKVVTGLVPGCSVDPPKMVHLSQWSGNQPGWIPRANHTLEKQSIQKGGKGGAPPKLPKPCWGSIVCFCCNKEGHQVVECPTLWPAIANQPQGLRKREKGLSKLKEMS